MTYDSSSHSSLFATVDATEGGSKKDRPREEFRRSTRDHSRISLFANRLGGWILLVRLGQKRHESCGACRDMTCPNWTDRLPLPLFCTIALRALYTFSVRNRPPEVWFRNAFKDAMTHPVRVSGYRFGTLYVTMR